MTPTIYTWSDLRHISPVFDSPIAWCLYWYDRYIPVEEALANLIPKLQNRPEGRRAVHLSHASEDLLSGVQNPLGMFTVWPNPAPFHEWLKRLCQGVLDAGLRIDRLILDIEAVRFNSWELRAIFGGDNGGDAGRANWFAQLWATQNQANGVYHKLPDYVKAHALSEYQAGWQDRDALIDWGRFSDGLVNSIWRQTITATIHDFFGPETPVSNWDDVYPRADRECLDQNGWPFVPGMGTDASPNLYMMFQGHLHWGRQMPAVWNRLIHCVNLMRAQRAPCVPWVTFARREPWWSENNCTYEDSAEVLRHCAEAGVDTYIYWYHDVPVLGPDEHQIAADVFSGLQVRPRVELPEIPFDATSIPHLPPIVPHVCPEPNVEGVRRSMAWELYGRDMLTAEDLIELGYPRRRMSRGPLQKILGC